MEQDFIKQKKELKQNLKPHKILYNFSLGSIIAIGVGVYGQYNKYYHIWKDIILSNLPSPEVLTYLDSKNINPWGYDLFTNMPLSFEDGLVQGASTLAMQSLNVGELAVIGVMGGAFATMFLTGAVNLPKIAKYAKIKKLNKEKPLELKN